MLTKRFTLGGLLAAATLAFAASSFSAHAVSPSSFAGAVDGLRNTPAMTDTHMMTGTMMMTDTHMMTGTMAMTDTHMMTDTMMMTDTHMMMMPDVSKMNAGQVVLAEKQFSTLARLVKLAGLTASFNARGPITMFAPTNDAFAKLPKATLDALAKDPKKLKAILLYHVSQGKVTSEDVKSMSGMEMPKMVAGGEVKFFLKDGALYANEAKVLQADVEVKNGVIHVIDTVLMPPAK